MIIYKPYSGWILSEWPYYRALRGGLNFGKPKKIIAIHIEKFIQKSSFYCWFVQMTLYFNRILFERFCKANSVFEMLPNCENKSWKYILTISVKIKVSLDWKIVTELWICGPKMTGFIRAILMVMINNGCNDLYFPQKWERLSYMIYMVSKKRSRELQQLTGVSGKYPQVRSQAALGA
jgi:hypothetical protein